MKNFGKLIIIPVLVMTLVIAGAIVYKFFLTPSNSTEPSASAADVPYNPYKDDENSNDTGGGFEEVNRTSGNPATDDLEQELLNAGDDGGLDEVDELQEEASEL